MPAVGTAVPGLPINSTNREKSDVTKRTLNSNLVIGGLLFIGCCGYLYQTFQLSAPIQRGEPGASFYPFILVAIMFAMSIVTFIRGLKDTHRFTPTLSKPAAVRVLLAALATVAFILLFPLAGYWIATGVYTFCIALIFEIGRRDSRLKAVAFCLALALIVTAAGWGFFVELFDLYLPTGELF